MYNGESNHPRRHATETAGLGGWHSERLGRQAQGHALKDSFAAHNHHDALFHISLQAMAA